MGFSPQKILNISQKIAKFMVHRHLSRARHAKFIAEMWPARVLLDPRLQDDDSTAGSSRFDSALSKD